MKKRVAIVGLGLMGGSLAIALKRAYPTWRLTGSDRPDVLAEARRLSLVDETEPRPEDAIRGAELVVLASPVKTITQHLGSLGSFFEKGALVTDMGSTKRQILAAAEHLPPEVDFIGGHPMAGKASSGPAAADGDLFRDAAWALVPRSKHAPSSAALQTLEEIVRAVGARPIVVDAVTHDRAVAVVSQLPQVLAVILCEQAASVDRGMDLAGPVFRNLARLASSSSPLWHDILTSNSDLVEEALADIEKRLGEARSELAGTGLVRHFEAAKQAVTRHPALSPEQRDAS
jgi:prephenate dehydrogenase